LNLVPLFDQKFLTRWGGNPAQEFLIGGTNASVTAKAASNECIIYPVLTAFKTMDDGIFSNPPSGISRAPPLSLSGSPVATKG
jgi:hypothetical protein